MISVITPTYNRPHYLREAVDSFIRQKGVHAEMIIVNDGGEETNAHKMLEDMATIRYFYKEHGGCPSALNYGIKRANGKFICILADDDLLYGERSLRSRRDALDDCEVVYTGFNKINGQGKITSSHGVSPVNKQQIFQQDYINIQSMMWRKEIHDRIGYFSEDLINNEDWEWKIKCLWECNVKALDKITVSSRYWGQNKSIVDRDMTNKCADMLIKRMKERYL